MKVVFSQNAYASVLVETCEKIRTETGGVFLGCYQDQTFYIVEAIDPGPHSVFREDYFEYDQPYTAHLINKRARMYEHKLGLIGLWHRHPGSFDIFSTTDDGTNEKYASLSENGAISMLVNIDPVFRLSVYHVSKDPSGRPRYTQLAYSVGDEHIPEEMRRLRSSEEICSKINLSSIRGMGLNHYVSLIVKRLHVVNDPASVPANVIPFPAAEGSDPDQAQADVTDKDKRERLIDYVLSDLTYLTDTIGFKLSTSWKGCELHVHDKRRDGSAVPVFSYHLMSNDKDCCIKFNSTFYECKKDMFHCELIDIKNTHSVREAHSTHTDDSPVSAARDATHSINSVLDGVCKFLYTFLGINQKE